VKVCIRCGEGKPLDRFSAGRKGRLIGTCKECINAVAKMKYKTDESYRNKCKESSKAIYASGTKKKYPSNHNWPSRSQEARSKENKRRAEKNGKIYKPRGDINTIQEKKDTRAKIKLLRQLIRATEYKERVALKPWTDKKLTENERYKLRYSLDEMFRIKEQQRQVIYKNNNPETAARSGDLRRVRASRQNDGSISRDKLYKLMTERLSCIYCSTKLTEMNRTLDHLIPLAKGGTHGVINLVLSCRSCNASKGSKDYGEWLEKLDGNHRLRALRLYVKRYGVEPDQQSFCLEYLSG
jgi:5-methylcytosine-specific restriction endonuclease McrA